VSIIIKANVNGQLYSGTLCYHKVVWLQISGEVADFIQALYGIDLRLKELKNR